MLQEGEYEVAPRVERIEQQIPAEWKAFAGKPMQITYGATKVNTFRDNPELLYPGDSFAAWATKELRRELGECVRLRTWTLASDADKLTQHSVCGRQGRCLSDAELKGIVCQEWRTDLTRNIVETRLNRHGSKDGPVVRRSPCGVLYIAPQPARSGSSAGAPTKLVLDAVATPETRKKAAAPK
jgi:hypothetical protein